MNAKAGLYFAEHGTGTPLLALHGLPVDHRLMVETLEPLLSSVPGYRRLYRDLPGMGKSPAAGEGGGTDAVVQTLLCFIDAILGDEPFLLVGQSYGGYLARAVTASRREQVLGMALICPLPIRWFAPSRREALSIPMPRWSRH